METIHEINESSLQACPGCVVTRVIDNTCSCVSSILTAPRRPYPWPNVESQEVFLQSTSDGHFSSFQDEELDDRRMDDEPGDSLRSLSMLRFSREGDGVRAAAADEGK